jgi:hypothetical protein
MLQYWGWSKQRYRNINKPSFVAAKNAAVTTLDACPVETIRLFFNRLWCFMDAYQMGLTGKAAEWAVRQQKCHRQAGKLAMMSIEAILG